MTFERFINRNVFAVVQIDLGRVDTAAGGRWLSELLDQSGLSKEEKEVGQATLRAWAQKGEPWIAGLSAAGGRHLYQFTGMPNIADTGTYWAFPVEQGKSSERLWEWLSDQVWEERRAPDRATHRAVDEGDAVLVATHTQRPFVKRQVEARVKWPEMAAALEAAANAPVRLAYWNNGWLLAELPELSKPESRARRLLEQVSWISLAVELPPTPRVKIVIRAKDPRAAEEFRRLASEGLKLLALEKEYAHLKATLELLVPRAEGASLTLDFDDKALRQLAPLIGPVWNSIEPR